MTTKIEICSNALQLIGDAPIADLTENTDRARACNAQYDYTRRKELRRRMWNCAIKRVVLSPMVDAPAFGFAYQFQLPADVVRVMSVTDDGSPQDYRIEAGRLLCDDSVVYLRYIFDNDDPSTYDAGFTNVLTLALAKQLAYTILNDNSRAQMLEQEYRFAVRDASAADGQERPSEPFNQSNLVAIRSIG